MPKNFLNKKPSQKMKVQGLQNKICGQSFENQVIMACENYKRKKIAFIEKTPEPFHIIKRIYDEGKLVGFMGFFEKQSQPDFKGTLAGGRSICFETKTTTQEKICQNIVTEEQGKDLTIHENLGALTFVLISLNLRRFFRVPWIIWRQMKEKYGHMYMVYKDLLPYEVLADRNGFIQFLK